MSESEFGCKVLELWQELNKERELCPEELACELGYLIREFIETNGICRGI